MKNILCALFVLSTITVKAQEKNCNFKISGITKEEHHAEPLSYAVIRILELDMSISSDDEGHYLFEDVCKGKYRLVCSFLGFRTDTQTVNVREDVGVFFNLHPENCELDEVVVKGNSVRHEIILNEPDESLANEGISLINEISGAGILQTGNNTSKPINHGLHSSRLRVIQAGASIENQQWGAEHGIELSGVRSFTLSDQNVLIYNHDGIGGALIANPSITVNYDSLFDSEGMFFSSANSNGKSGKVGGELSSNFGFAPWLGAKVFGSISQGGDVQSPNYNLNNTGFKNYDFGFMLDAKHEKFTSTLFYSIVNQELGIFSGSHIESVTDFQNAIDAESPNESHTGDFDYLIEGPKQTVEHELVSYKLNFDEKYEVQVSRQFNKREEFEGHAGEVPEIDLQLNITTYNGDLRHYSNYKNWNTTIGINAMNQVNTWEYRAFIPNFHNQRLGGYAVAKNESFKDNKIAVQLGVRYDYYLNKYYLLSGNVDQNFSNLSYELSLAKKVIYDYNLSFTHGMSWRPPSANELFSDGIHHGAATFEKGDVSLTKEVAYQNQVNLTKNFRKLKGEVSVYSNYIQNFIYSQPSGDVLLTVKGAFPEYQYVQTDALLYGSDFEFDYNYSDRLKFESKYSVVKTYDFRTNNSLIGIMPSRVEQKVSFKSKNFNKYDNENFVRHNWQFTFGGKYFFKRENTNLNLEFASPPNGYVIFNSVFTYQIKSKVDYQPINIRFSVNNLLNTTYRNYMNRYRYFADEMGRNFKFSLEIPFEIINKNK